MAVMNDLDRFHLADDAIDRVLALRRVGAHAKQVIRDRLIEHREYIERYGEDMPAIRDWCWSGQP